MGLGKLNPFDTLYQSKVKGKVPKENVLRLGGIPVEIRLSGIPYIKED